MQTTHASSQTTGITVVSSRTRTVAVFLHNGNRRRELDFYGTVSDQGLSLVWQYLPLGCDDQIDELALRGCKIGDQLIHQQSQVQAAKTSSSRIDEPASLLCGPYIPRTKREGFSFEPLHQGCLSTISVNSYDLSDATLRILCTPSGRDDPRPIRKEWWPSASPSIPPPVSLLELYAVWSHANADNYL
ncbi:hypothetical protein EJ03DRAFT_326130 [Teratosphaeria nubilosa]|uniref:Uncharacterized protein n=1 Tax=Teratosphaeria nubilosa TaxID=161662 RepID=A0A6G1LDU0_9PEZI|nr:hypothetical protein EJ03DRAFT_326130 [Teratosphaeria nubilosa]